MCSVANIYRKNEIKSIGENDSNPIKIQQHFTCSKCGSCCTHLTAFHGVYDALDRGDGICMHFNESTRLCTIYGSRPNLCRVEEGYQLFDALDWDEYIIKMYSACKYLRSLGTNACTTYEENDE